MTPIQLVNRFFSDNKMDVALLDANGEMRELWTYKINKNTLGLFAHAFNDIELVVWAGANEREASIILHYKYVHSDGNRNGYTVRLRLLDGKFINA